MLDTQADISIIKKSSIKKYISINNSHTVKITGITTDAIYSLGTVEANINFYKQFSIIQIFHVVPDSFSIPAEGILGKDFLKNNYCTINYETMELRIKQMNQLPYYLPILQGPSEETVMLPARCEVFRELICENSNISKTNPFVLFPQSISPGVFISRAIIDRTNPIVRIMNTNSDPVIIRKNVIKMIDSLDNYNVYNIDTPDNSERNNKIDKFLPNDMPDEVEIEFKNLCHKYSDIFSLNTDIMTINNFYK